MMRGGLTLGSSIAGFSWIGCYRETLGSGVRALSDDKLPDSVNVTVEVCAQYGVSVYLPTNVRATLILS